MQGGLALSSPCRSCNKDNLKTSTVHALSWLWARMQAEMQPRQRVPAMSWQVSELPGTDAQGCPPAPGSGALVWKLQGGSGVVGPAGCPWDCLY